MTEHVSTRVNSKHLAQFQGRTIRIVGKILKVALFLHNLGSLSLLLHTYLYCIRYLGGKTLTYHDGLSSDMIFHIMINTSSMVTLRSC